MRETKSVLEGIKEMFQDDPTHMVNRTLIDQKYLKEQRKRSQSI